MSLQWGVSSIVINFFKQILFVPIFIQSVGKDGYAFWLIISAIVLMVRAINLGQLYYSSNVINLSYHQGKDVNEAINTGQGASLVMMLFQVLVTFILCSKTILRSFLDYNDLQFSELKVGESLFYLSISLIIYQYTTMFMVRFFEPLGKVNITIKHQTLGELYDFIVTIVGIYFTKSVYYTCIFLLIGKCLQSIYLFFYCKKNLPFDLKFNFNQFDLSKSFDAIKKSFILSISFIIEKIYEIGLSLVVSRAYNSLTVTLFGTNRIISNSALRVSNIATTPLMPNLQKYFSLNQKTQILDLISSFWKLSGNLLIVGIVVFTPIIPRIFNIWTLGKIDFNIQLLAFLLIAILFQNYSMILSEFIKRVNMGKIILIYNIIKISITVSVLFLGGYINNVVYLGLSLALGEITSLIFLIYCVSRLFEGREFLSIAIKYILPLVIFSTLYFLYSCNKLPYTYLVVLSLSSFVIFNIEILKKIINKYK
ncbi:hypothetical protein [Sphingobacterium zeae]|nr:hypothetical protein [Sphingobacterium zeae]